MTFAQPYWLFLLALIPLAFWYYRRTLPQRHISLKVSRLEAMKGVKTWVLYARYFLQGIRWSAIAILILAMARPQQQWDEEQIDAESIDIILVLDLSPSMLSRDFAPDRLSAARAIATDFINRRRYDRLGLVVFSGGAFTQCPLTSDRRMIKVFLNNLQVGRLDDGSAIGLGIATAVNHLKDSEAAGKVVIVLTDGENNTGDPTPLQAAEIASALGVRTYTIGIGKDGEVSSPYRLRADGAFEYATRTMQLDTLMLTQVAALTGGEFFRADRPDKLEKIYAAIDRLEKTRIESTVVLRTNDLFFYFLNLAFCLLLLELVLRWGALRVMTV